MATINYNTLLYEYADGVLSRYFGSMYLCKCSHPRARTVPRRGSSWRPPHVKVWVSRSCFFWRVLYFRHSWFFHLTPQTRATFEPRHWSAEPEATSRPFEDPFGHRCDKPDRVGSRCHRSPISHTRCSLRGVGPGTFTHHSSHAGILTHPSVYRKTKRTPYRRANRCHWTAELRDCRGGQVAVCRAERAASGLQQGKPLVRLVAV